MVETGDWISSCKDNNRQPDVLAEKAKNSLLQHAFGFICA